MPTPTYDLISTTTLAATTTEVLFGSLPQTYRDVVLVYNASITGGGHGVRINGDSGANYNENYIRGGAGNDALSYAATPSTINPASGTGDPANSRFLTKIDFLSYSATDQQKSILVRHNNPVSLAGGHVQLQYVRWANTNAITSILVWSSGGVFNAGSTFSIYGIVA